MSVLSYGQAGCDSYSAGSETITYKANNVDKCFTGRETLDVEYDIVDSFCGKIFVDIFGVAQPINSGTRTYDYSVSVTYYMIGSNPKPLTTVSVLRTAGTYGKTILNIDPYAFNSNLNPGDSQLIITNVIGSYLGTPAVPIVPVTPFTIRQNIAPMGNSFLAFPTIQQPIMVGNSGLVTYNLPVADGIYTLNYSLEGANVIPLIGEDLNIFSPTFSYGIGQIVTMVVSNGIGTFYISNANLLNAGLTKFVPINLKNALGCEMVFGFFGAKAKYDFVVSPRPDVTGSKNITINPFCQGTNGSVQFTSSAIVDGNYNITYSLSGSNNLASTIFNVNFISGVTNFIIPSSQVPNSGNTTVSILSISDGSGSSTYIPSVDYVFTINPTPKVNGTNSIN